MNKKIKIETLAIFAVIITIIALILVSITYAKYTSDVTGADAATVAKWSFKVGGTDIAGKSASTELEFDIFGTVTNEDNTAEQNIESTDGSLIAPGTKGSFKISLSNDSEVNAEYKVTYSLENTSNVPLQFSTDDSTWGNVGDVSKINSNTFTSIGNGETQDTATIYWKWAFNGTDDTTDTKLGTSAPEVKVKATIEARQVD